MEVCPRSRCVRACVGGYTRTARGTGGCRRAPPKKWVKWVFGFWFSSFLTFFSAGERAAPLPGDTSPAARVLADTPHSPASTPPPAHTPHTYNAGRGRLPRQPPGRPDRPRLAPIAAVGVPLCRPPDPPPGNARHRLPGLWGGVQWGTLWHPQIAGRAVHVGCGLVAGGRRVERRRGLVGKFLEEGNEMEGGWGWRVATSAGALSMQTLAGRVAERWRVSWAGRGGGAQLVGTKKNTRREAAVPLPPATRARGCFLTLFPLSLYIPALHRRRRQRLLRLAGRPRPQP